MGRYRSYTITQKLAFLDQLENEYKNNAAEMARSIQGLSVSALKRWRKDGREKLMKSMNGNLKRKRKPLALKGKSRYEDLEKMMYEEFLLQQEQQGDTSDIWIQNRMRALIAEHRPELTSSKRSDGKAFFCGSDRWVRRFKQRAGIECVSRSTKKMAYIEFIPVFKEWIHSYRTLLKNSGEMISPLGFIDKCDLYNMDQTPIHLSGFIKKVNRTRGSDFGDKLHARFTVDVEKRYATLCITIRADAYGQAESRFHVRHMKPLILFRGKSQASEPEKRKYDSRVHVYRQKNAWFDSEVARHYAALFARSIPEPKSRDRIMLLDNLGAHKHDDFVKMLQDSCRTTAVFLPENTTHFSQPVDRHVAQTIKTFFMKEMADWFHSINQAAFKKKKEHVISISELRVQTVKALANAWEIFLKEHTHCQKVSFSEIGLSLPIDGSKDKDINFRGQPDGTQHNFGVE